MALTEKEIQDVHNSILFYLNKAQKWTESNLFIKNQYENIPYETIQQQLSTIDPIILNAIQRSSYICGQMNALSREEAP